MASKEAAKAEAKAAPKTEKAPKKEAPVEEVEFYAFEFSLPVAKIGDKTTNPQVKSKVGDAFLGYGRFTETQVAGAIGQDRTVTIFFAQLFGKGQPQWDALKKNEKAVVKVYDEDVELRLSGAKPSGGGATTGTSSRPKKEAPKGTGRGRGRGERRPREDSKGGEKKEGEKKEGEEKKEDGGRGRGRGRAPKKDEGPKTSLQRGRANIGGKLGPVSKVRLAKQAKEARDKENAARIARGEAPLEDKKVEKDEPELPKKDAKKEAGKKGGDAKKEAGKKEAGKGEAKKEAGKKGK